MKINFNDMDETVIKNFNGGEKEIAAKMYIDEVGNKIMHGRLIPGASIGMHKHEVNCEMLYVLSGSGRVKNEGADEILTAGDCTYCPKGHSHSLINDSNEDLVFFCVVPMQK